MEWPRGSCAILLKMSPVNKVFCQLYLKVLKDKFKPNNSFYESLSSQQLSLQNSQKFKV